MHYCDRLGGCEEQMQSFVWWYAFLDAVCPVALKEQWLDLTRSGCCACARASALASTVTLLQSLKLLCAYAAGVEQVCAHARVVSSTIELRMRYNGHYTSLNKKYHIMY
jgi:hypothetical protein